MLLITYDRQLPTHREPWNKGKLVGPKPPFRLQEIWAIRIRLEIENRVRETGGARADDNVETLKKRLQVYHDQTAPVLPYYRGKNILHEVDGLQSIETVAEEIDKVLTKSS